MKRKGPVLEDPSHDAKKQKTTNPSKHPLRLKCRQRGLLALVEHPQDGALFDRELSRTICVALHGMGFDGAKSSALESFQAAVEEYMLRFARKVQASMQSSRRQDPVPQDFIYALSQFGLRPSALLAERDLNVPAKVTQAPILPPTRDDGSSLFAIPNFVDPNESSIEHKTSRQYIPKHFPSFPAQHAYQETPVFTERETDALKVRERATQEGVQAEAALRKLMAAKKAASGRDGRTRGRRKPPEAQQRGEALWRAAMEAVVEEDKRRLRETVGDSGVFGMDGIGNDKEEALEPLMTAVNHDRAYWRRRGREGGVLL